MSVHSIMNINRIFNRKPRVTLKPPLLENNIQCIPIHIPNDIIL